MNITDMSKRNNGNTDDAVRHTSPNISCSTATPAVRPFANGLSRSSDSTDEGDDDRAREAAAAEGEDGSDMSDIDLHCRHVALFSNKKGGVDYFLRNKPQGRQRAVDRSHFSPGGQLIDRDSQKSEASRTRTDVTSVRSNSPALCDESNSNSNNGDELITAAMTRNSFLEGTPMDFPQNRVASPQYRTPMTTSVTQYETQLIRSFQCPCCESILQLSLENNKNNNTSSPSMQSKEWEEEERKMKASFLSALVVHIEREGRNKLLKKEHVVLDPVISQDMTLHKRFPLMQEWQHNRNYLYHHRQQEASPRERRQLQERSTGRRNSNRNNDISLFALLPTFSPTSFVRAYVGEGNYPWEATLHNRPALIVSCCAAAMNFVVVQFLQNHVLDTRDHLGLFVIGTYIIFSSYYLAYYFLERYSLSFSRISQDKKFYTIANLIKAGILVSLVPFAVLHLGNIIIFDYWDTNILQNLGCIYTIPDFVSMIVVKRMSWSTWIHHLCVLLFNFFSTMNDYTQENICRCVVVYAAFSTFAYCVNVLLASRFLGVPPYVARVLSYVAVVVYILCCATNWSWQVYYIRKLLQGGHGHWTVYVYMILICLVMYDDITLNKWLLHNAKSTAFSAAHSWEHQQAQRMPPRVGRSG